MTGPFWIEVDDSGALLRASDAVRQHLAPMYGADLGLAAVVRTRPDLRAALVRRAGRLRVGLGRGGALTRWDLDISAGVHGARVVLVEAAEPDWPALTSRWAADCPDGVVITDADGRVRWANAAFCEQVGYDRDELEGLSMSAFRSHRVADRVVHGMNMALTGTGSWVGGLVYRRSDGVEYPVRVSLTALRDESGRVTDLLGVIADLTEDRERDRLESIDESAVLLGRMARGMAHDVNNLSGELVALLDQSEEAGKSPDLSRLRHVGAALGELGRQMLTLATHNAEPPPADLNRVAQDLVWLLTRASVGTRSFSLSLSEVPLWVEAQADGLLRALIQPALRAATLLRVDDKLHVSVSEAGGLGEISLAYEADATERERLRVLFPDTHTASHTGNRLRTRAFGAGANLSLDINGAQVRLSARAPVRAPVIAEVSPPVLARPRYHRALVVEDTEPLREMVMTALKRDFPEVLGAFDGQDGLDVLERVGGQVDIAVVDLMMPRLQGLDFVEQAKARWPELSFVIMSGAASADQVVRARELGVRTLLAKPFRLVELRDACKDTLAGPT